MSYRHRLLASRIAGLESHVDEPNVDTAVTDAVEEVAADIVEAAVEKAKEATAEVTEPEAVVTETEVVAADEAVEEAAEEVADAVEEVDAEVPAETESEAVADSEEAADTESTTEEESDATAEEAESAEEDSTAAEETSAVEEGGDAEADDTTEEEQSSEEEVEVEETADADAVLDSGAEEILEINAEGDDVDEEEEFIEETAEIANGLESIALAMEQSLDQGGLTPMAAAGYHIAIESYLSRACIPNTTMPSMESFGGSGTRVEYTNISVENARERAGELWRALLEMLEKAREMVVNFFKKVFSQTGQLKAKAESIAKAAAGLDGVAPNEVGGSVAAKLSVGGKMPADVAGELSKLGKLLDAAYKYADSAAGYAAAVNAGVAGIDSGSDEKFVAGVKSMIEAVTKATPDFAAATADYKGNETAGVGMVGKQTDTFLGEVKVVAVRLGDVNVDQAAAIRGLTTQRNIVDVGKGATEENVPTLKKEQIQAIATAVLEIIKSVDSYKETANKVDKALGDITKAGRSFQRMASKADGLSGENKRLVNSVTGIVRSVSPVVAQPAQKLTQHSLVVCQAALKYCADSIKAHSTAPAPATTEAA